MRREFERPEDRHHAVRLVTRRGGDFAAAFQRFAAALVIRLNSQRDFTKDSIDFGRRFPFRLAGRAADRLDQIRATRLHLLSERFEKSDALGEGAWRPVFKCPTRRLDGAIDVTRSRGAAAPDELA